MKHVRVYLYPILNCGINYAQKFSRLLYEIFTNVLCSSHSLHYAPNMNKIALKILLYTYELFY